MPLNSHL